MSVKLLTEHHFRVSKLKRRLQGLVRVYTCQNATLLEISCTGSIIKIQYFAWFYSFVFRSKLLRKTMTVEGEDSEGYLPCLDEDLQFFEVNKNLVYYNFPQMFICSYVLTCTPVRGFGQ